MTYEYCTADYHGLLWGSLVECGWVTMYVTDGVAYMIRQWHQGSIQT